MSRIAARPPATGLRATRGPSTALLVALSAALLLAGCRPAEVLYRPMVSASEIGVHIGVLAADSLLGRAPGHPGGEKAARYIASVFERYGLQPPDTSYFQPVPVIGNEPIAESVSLSFAGASAEVMPRYLDGFVMNPGYPDAINAIGEGELVFVGYGIDAPENRWDDFAGADLAGKFMLILVNDPPAPPEEPGLFGGRAMTYYGRWTYKYEEAARQGALGALIVHETGPAGYPWSVVRGGFSGEQFSLSPNPDAATPTSFLGWVSLDVARAALAAGGLDFDELKASAARRGFTAVPTGVTVRARLDARVRRLDTENVVGLLPGATRPDEYILVTAHYDHFGIGEPVRGDSIYNGAYDNASGTALMLAIAKALAGRERPLDRSVLFIATAAEEQGLLGAEWYAQAPLRPLNRTVATLNLDGANVWGETTDVQVLGEERSELGAYVRTRAREVGLSIEPEESPEVGTYFRSDHFPLAKAGVPALYFKHGWSFVGRPAGWGDSIHADYTANHYHAPSDEVRPEWRYEGAARDGTLIVLTIADLASTDAWPNWHAGQEFRAARDAMMSRR
jgi:Zn-dependent M28 family amino/carboxypeptidase